MLVAFRFRPHRGPRGGQSGPRLSRFDLNFQILSAASEVHPRVDLSHVEPGWLRHPNFFSPSVWVQSSFGGVTSSKRHRRAPPSFAPPHPLHHSLPPA